MRYRTRPRVSSRAFLLAALVGSLLPVSALAEEMVKFHGRWLTAAQAAEYRAKEVAATSSPAWGTLSTSLYTLGPCDAGIRDFAASPYTTEALGGCGRLEPSLPGPTEGMAGFPVHLPTGALITEVTVNYFDSHTTDDPSLGMWEATATGNQSLVVGLSPGPFSAGNNSQTFVVDPPYPVDNTRTLAVLAILDKASGTESEGIYSFAVRYQLQVSPAPGAATFNDVPTSHPFFRFVEALAASGITAGCGGGNFCPDNPLTRGQMAVFLSIALGLHFPN